MSSWTLDDMPDLSGSTAVVTGANSGIGAVTALVLARSGARTILACRSPEKGRRAVDAVRRAAPRADARLVTLDLADLSSVAEAADAITKEVEGRLDLLVNNAGVMAIPLLRTADGFETQFGTNHLGHFALTQRLLPVLGVHGPARVVTVSSLGHRLGRIDLDDLNSHRAYHPWGAYGRSKLANLLFTAELDRRARASGRDLLALAAHPGLAATDLGQVGPRLAGRAWLARLERLTRLYTQRASVGALPSLYAATLPDAPGGAYYGPRHLAETRGAPAPARRSARARDADTARALWEESARLTHLPGSGLTARQPTGPARDVTPGSRARARPTVPFSCGPGERVGVAGLARGAFTTITGVAGGSAALWDGRTARMTFRLLHVRARSRVRGGNSSG